MAIKLDMAKAYDHVEWEFLLTMMARLGFAPVFCGWIKECISTASFSILVNGNLTGYILPERGLRHEDPLSPYLFLLCTEGFSMLIRNGLEQGALHEFKITPNGVPVTHLFFTDDSVLFGNALMEEAQWVAKVLKVYAWGSGQEINLSKSTIFFGSKTKSPIFEEVRDKIETRVGLSEQFLSQAGKEVLVKAVVMAMPNYAMSCFKLPIGVCRDMEKAIRNYWWRGNEQRKGVNWISWDRLMKQKRAGGLGFRDIQCFNLAFLAKIGWHLTQNPMSLLAIVLRDKYFPGGTFMGACRGKNTFWGWKGIF
ncbi:hypothetical protein ACFX2I_046250 [Malus domestica]